MFLVRQWLSKEQEAGRPKLHRLVVSAPYELVREYLFSKRIGVWFISILAAKFINC